MFNKLDLKKLIKQNASYLNLRLSSRNKAKQMLAHYYVVSGS